MLRKVGIMFRSLVRKMIVALISHTLLYPLTQETQNRYAALRRTKR